MAQLIAEQALVVLQTRAETERPERPAARRDEVPGPPRDENVDEMVMKRPSRFVAARYRPLKQAHHVVDEDGRNGKRTTKSVVCGQERHFLPCQQRAPAGGLGGRQGGVGPPIGKDFEGLIEGA